MQAVVVVNGRGLTAVGATRRARGYMICMRERPRAREKLYNAYENLFHQNIIHFDHCVSLSAAVFSSSILSP